MKHSKLILATIMTGAIVAVLYTAFERAVHHSIDLIWIDWFNSNAQRAYVLPICIVLGFIYFGAQHYFDKKNEHDSTESLTESPEATPVSLAEVIGIGFLSLVAGASLGPEAILVPASLMSGGLLAKKFFGNKNSNSQILELAGFAALFTAFFSSWIIGVLGGMLLLSKRGKEARLPLVITAATASVTAYLVLQALPHKPYISLPEFTFDLSWGAIFSLVGLIFSGAISVICLSAIIKSSRLLNSAKLQWWQQAFIASLVLSILYILGGPLVQFTGNESIAPLWDQASELGTFGLLWIIVVKLVAIGWSKAIGYRGGLIFPLVFVGATWVTVVHQSFYSINLGYGIVAFLLGSFIINARIKILF